MLVILIILLAGFAFLFFTNVFFKKQRSSKEQMADSLLDSGEMEMKESPPEVKSSTNEQWIFYGLSFCMVLAGIVTLWRDRSSMLAAAILIVLPLLFVLNDLWHRR